jgi:hypothetical protein
MDADKDKDTSSIEKEDHTTNPDVLNDALDDVVQGEEKEEHSAIEGKKEKKEKKQQTELFAVSSLIGLSKKEANTRFEICKYFVLLLFVLSDFSNSTFFYISSNCLRTMVES